MEGAIYNLGVIEGLRQWKKFLKDNGFMVFSDLVWYTAEGPDVLTSYFTNECHYILNVNEVINAATNEDYAVVYNFSIPKSEWLDEYIFPQKLLIPELKEKSTSVKETQKTFQAIEYENMLVEKYLGYFGYEFFISRNNQINLRSDNSIRIPDQISNLKFQLFKKRIKKLRIRIIV